MSFGAWAAAVSCAGIGLVALALGMSARRHMRQSFFVGLVGLATLAGSSAWIALASSIVPPPLPPPVPPTKAAPGPAVEPKPAEPDDAQRLREMLGLVQKQRDEALNGLNRSQGEVGNLKTRIAGLEAEVAPLREMLKQAGQQRDEALEAARLAREQSAHLQSEADSLRARVAVLVAEAARLKTARLLPMLTSPAYALHPLDQPEMVAGLRGRWFTVRLGPKLAFPDRAFRILGDEARIRDHAKVFRQEVLDLLRADKVDFRLFASGSADERRLAQPADQPDAATYTALPRSAGGVHLPRGEPRSVAVVDNRDLPNLRALWLAKTVTPALGAEVEILDQAPQGRERSAELLLFVPF